MIKKQIEKVVDGQHLSYAETHGVMLHIMNGEVNNGQIAALLIALKCKGETAEEVAGFAQAMRDKSVKIKSDGGITVDVCGTGGDYSGTFNVSTAAAFVVAGVGVKVAKHGNRSISSKSGSADVLEKLGININLTPEYSQRALNELGITFLFAPNHHPAMKYVATVRKELGMKTIFNILGPLTNPAGTTKQLIGTFNTHTANIMAQAAHRLAMEKVCFVCTANRFDEVSLTEETEVHEYSNSEGIKKYVISHTTFDFPKINAHDLKGDSPERNAEILLELLTLKRKNPVYFVTIANAAMALYSADYSTDLKDCTTAAEESILSGKALEKLEQLREFGKNR